MLLDAIASGEISTFQSNNPYEYFNSQALHDLSSMSGNLWAGAEHWKKMSSSTIKRRKTATGDDDGNKLTTSSVKKTKGKGRRTKTGTKDSGDDRPALVDITRPVANLDELLKKPKKSGRSKKSENDPLLLTKAMKTKYEKDDNLLPLDAGLGISQLTTLFLRPNTNLAEMAAQKNREMATRRPVSTPKTVGFGGVETLGNTLYEEHDDDGGAGFDFGGGGGEDYDHDDTQDFVIPDLEDVRKVEKIRVGYATVAKKVDVKRLKMDLWNELERTFQKQRGNVQGDQSEEANESKQEDDETPADVAPETVLKEGDLTIAPLSFQSTLRDMQATQSQRDVTLPFYFICILHLCNEKGLALESRGLDDFVIHSS